MLPFIRTVVSLAILTMIVGAFSGPCWGQRPNVGKDPVQDMLERHRRATNPPSFPTPGTSPGIPNNFESVGECSNCRRTIRGAATRGSKCPFCGARWVNRSSGMSNFSNNTFDETNRSGRNRQRSFGTILILGVLVGGIVFMLLIAGVVYIVVKKMMDDHKKHNRRVVPRKVNRYR